MRLAAIGILGLLACGHAAAGEEAAASDILSGSPSSNTAVVVLGSEEDYLACSGTLIAPDVVLTAAHCFMGTMVLESVYVGYAHEAPSGSTLAYEGGDYRRYRIVDEAVMSPLDISTCPGKGIDVALLRLDAPVTGVTPVRLADRAPAIGDECVVAGYGRYAPGMDLVEGANQDWTTGERREARIRMFGKGEGARPEWFSAKAIDGAHAGGDSGGPLLCGGKIAGIVSCTVDKVVHVPDLVKVYANLELAKPFIEATLRKWTVIPPAE